MQEWQIRAAMTVLKGLGLPVDDIMAKAQQFATDGSLDTILQFAGQLKEHNVRLARIEGFLLDILEKEGEEKRVVAEQFLIAPCSNTRDSVGVGSVRTGEREAFS